MCAFTNPSQHKSQTRQKCSTCAVDCSPSESFTRCIQEKNKYHSEPLISKTTQALHTKIGQLHQVKPRGKTFVNEKLSDSFDSDKTELPRSARPPIPEPQYRVGPKGVSSGLSFRSLPSPSLKAISDVCDHYENKCSGKYTSLASRYVFQMAHEIRTQIEALQKNNQRQVKKQKTVKETEEKEIPDLFIQCGIHSPDVHHCGGKESEGDKSLEAFFKQQHGEAASSLEKNELMTRSDQIKLLVSSNISMKDHILKQGGAILNLEMELKSARIEAENARTNAIRDMESHISALRKSAEVDQMRFYDITTSMKRQYQIDMNSANAEIKKVKEEATQSMQSIEQNYRQRLNEILNKNEDEKNELTVVYQTREDKMVKHFNKHRKIMEHKIQKADNHEKEHVKKVTTELKQKHAVAMASAKRQAVVRGSNAVLNQVRKMELLGVSPQLGEGGGVIGSIVSNNNQANAHQTNGLIAASAATICEAAQRQPNAPPELLQVCRKTQRSSKQLQCRVGNLEQWVGALAGSMRGKKANLALNKSISNALPHGRKELDPSRFTFQTAKGPPWDGGHSKGAGVLFHYVLPPPPPTSKSVAAMAPTVAAS